METRQSEWPLMPMRLRGPPRAPRWSLNLTRIPSEAKGRSTVDDEPSALAAMLLERKRGRTVEVRDRVNVDVVQENARRARRRTDSTKEHLLSEQSARSWLTKERLISEQFARHWLLHEHHGLEVVSPRADLVIHRHRRLKRRLHRP